MQKMFAVIRMAGNVGMTRKIRDKLKILGLHAVNNCVVLPDTPSYRGMITRIRDYVAYGTIDMETLAAMLEKRGRTEDNKRLSEKTLKVMGCKTTEELAKVLVEGKTTMKAAGLKRIFRLTPPSHGFKSTRKQWPRGDLGDRKEAINELIERMI